MKEIKRYKYRPTGMVEDGVVTPETAGGYAKAYDALCLTTELDLAEKNLDAEIKSSQEWFGKHEKVEAELEQAKAAFINEREQHIAATQLNAEFLNEVFRPMEAELEQVKAEASEATEYLRWALEWIDSVPDDTLLPAMPGFDREDVDEFLSKQEGK